MALALTAGIAHADAPASAPGAQAAPGAPSARPQMPPDEKILFQPRPPAGWSEAAQATVSVPAGTILLLGKKYVPTAPWQPDWDESLVVTVVRGAGYDTAAAVARGRKSQTELHTSLCRVTPQVMYNDSEPANGYAAAMDVLFCPNDGEGKASYSIGKFIRGRENLYAAHRIWRFPPADRVPVTLEEQRRWIGILAAAVVCDDTPGGHPCKIGPGPWTAMVPREPSASALATNRIMATLAQQQPGSGAPNAPAQASPASRLYGVVLEQASRPALRRAIQENGLMPIRLDLIDGIDSYKPGPEMANASQLDVRYRGDGSFVSADYIFPPDTDVERLGDMLKGRFGNLPPTASNRDAVRWQASPALQVELRREANRVVLSYRRM